MTSPFTIDAFDHYWTMWNTTDQSQVRKHLDRAVSDSFIFCDPLHFHTGRQALEDNVRSFRTEWPTATLVIASGVDKHHNRHRYRWNLINENSILVKGLDIATVDADGLIERIDGFFGAVPEPLPAGPPRVSPS